jgi:hypothetical protein
MGTSEPEQTPYLRDESHCGQSSTDESEQFLRVQVVPPFTYVVVVYLSLCQTDACRQLCHGSQRQHRLKMLAGGTCEEKAVNATSADQDILGRGLGRARSPEDLTLSTVKKEATLTERHRNSLPRFREIADFPSSA